MSASDNTDYRTLAAPALLLIGNIFQSGILFAFVPCQDGGKTSFPVVCRILFWFLSGSVFL